MLVGIGITIIVLVVLYILGGLIFVHRLVVSKLIMIILVAGIGLFLYGRAQNQDIVKVILPEYMINAPSITDAPYVLPTSSRLYYVVDASDDGKILTLKTYYDYENNEWIYRNKPLPLDRKYCGDIQLIHR